MAEIHLNYPHLPLHKRKGKSSIKKVFDALQIPSHWKYISTSKLFQTYAAYWLSFLCSVLPLHCRSIQFHSASDMPGVSRFVNDKSRMKIDPNQPITSFSDDQFDAILNENAEEQTQIANNMIQMARVLKTQSLNAQKVIKRDIKKLEETKTCADSNAELLNKTSKKLARCSKDGMNWWLIILVVAVTMIFINMVIFMKVMKKN